MSATNPLAAYQPFPELPAVLTTYVAERSSEEPSIDGPPPWDIGVLPPDLLDPLNEWLDPVCRWLNRTYAWQPQHVIPPCWRLHEGLTYEIAALAFARTDAYQDAGAAVVWHEQWDRFLSRMNTALGKAGEQCRVGRHEERPARFHLAAWPTVGTPQEEMGQ
ncbi:hypothetical protein [Streptomyces chrestomyceticus]|uniref:hypothetical protein n=1 Tax=Streptomyces chrestomyceticus TaxID=68185 RepID=UPI003402F1BC